MGILGPHADLETAPTVEERLKELWARAASTIKDEFKTVLLEMGKHLLEGASLTFCVRNEHGAVIKVDVQAVVIPRGFDHPALPRIILMSNGIFDGYPCHCGIVAVNRHFSFSSLKEYSAEDYVSARATVLSGVKYLDSKQPAVTDTT